MNHKVQLAYEAQKMVLYVLLGLIYVSFICMQLGNIQAITDYSFTLHELLFLPANLTIFVGPVLLLLYIVLLIRYLKMRDRKKPSSRAVLKFTAVMLSLCIIGAITIYQFGAVLTTGFFIVEHKSEYDGDYYIYAADMEIEVTKEQYDFLELDQEYYMRFKWHELTPDKGTLESVEDSTS